MVSIALSLVPDTVWTGWKRSDNVGTWSSDTLAIWTVGDSTSRKT